MPRRQRRTTGYLTEAERHLGVKTVNRAEPNLELLGRIIVDLAMAELAPVKPQASDVSGLAPRLREPANRS